MAKFKTALPLLTLLSLTSAVSATATCYKLNGDAAYKDFIPCNEFAGSTSYCCGANRQNTNASITNDVCLTNGLCLAVAEVEGVVEYNYFRESCSSTDWPTDSCLRNVCTTPDQNDLNGNAIMTPCENTTYSQTWCCGKNNTACCGTDSEITLAVTLGATATLTSSTAFSTSTGGSTTAATSSSAATTTPASSNPSTAPATNDSSLSTGAQAGIGVGVAVGALAIIGAGVLWYVRRRRAAAAARPTSHEDASLMQMTPESPNQPLKEVYVPHAQELDSRTMGHELDPAGLGEMPGDTEFKRT